MFRQILGITLVFLLCMAASAPLCAAEILSIDRDGALSGTVSGIDDQKRLLVTPSGKETSIGVRMDGIQEIDFGRGVAVPEVADARFRFVFDDGTALFGDVSAFEGDEALDWLSISSLTKGKLKTRYDGLTRIERREDAKAGQDLPLSDEEKKNVKPGLDWKLYKASGDSSFACAELTLYPNKVEFLIDMGLDEIATLWQEVRSIVRTGSKEAPFTELYALVTSKRGERFVGAIDGWKDGTLTMRTRHFGTIEVKESDLSTIVFRNGRFTFLSDIDPQKVEEYPYLRSTTFKQKDHLFPFQRDMAQGGGAISIGNKRFAKGLGVHAISRLSYRLDKQYTRFIATIGIDDSAGEKASVVFRVYVDGKELPMKVLGGSEAKEMANSGVMRKSSAAITIEVDTLQAKEITLVVEAADNADIHDRANWANAMFVR